MPSNPCGQTRCSWTPLQASWPGPRPWHDTRWGDSCQHSVPCRTLACCCACLHCGGLPVDQQRPSPCTAVRASCCWMLHRPSCRAWIQLTVNQQAPTHQQQQQQHWLWNPTATSSSRTSSSNSSSRQTCRKAGRCPALSCAQSSLTKPHCCPLASLHPGLTQPWQQWRHTYSSTSCSRADRYVRDEGAGATLGELGVVKN